MENIFEISDKGGRKIYIMMMMMKEIS